MGKQDVDINLNLEKVLMISFGFFVMFIAYLSCQNLASKILEDLGFESLGLLSVSLIYFVYACNSMMAAKIIKKFGTRMTLCLSGLSYSFWIGSFLVPAYKHSKIQEGVDPEELVSDEFIIGLFLISGFILGLGAGPLWVSQNYYVTDCANDQNKGRFNSLFWGLFQACNLISFPLAGFLISKFSKMAFYIVMTALSILGAVFLLLLKKPDEQR